MRLFVTEKPAVASELAGYLARKHKKPLTRHQRYISVGEDVITWAIGHLLEQAPPEFYCEGKGTWASVPLPIIPRPFRYQPAEDKERRAQLNEIGRLMKQAEEIYNATDLDREGQLIFDEIAEYFQIKKKIKRLLFSALNDASLDKAFADVADNDAPHIRNRGLAAKARGQADWLVGMNGTRAMTLAHGGKKSGVINVGRVMVPTLSIVVKRYLEIKNFKPRPFFIPMVTLSDGAVLVWKKRLNAENVSGIDSEGRIIDRALAEEIVASINAGLEGNITEAKAIEKTQEPPLPFSLPSLQSDLSRRYGLSVAEITKACQRLYERKMQTYPGTDCRYLPESMHGEAGAVLAGLRAQFGSLLDGVNLERKYRCWDNRKVDGDGGAAHHAIIPTGNGGAFESEAERLVYDAVCRRYIAQFYPEYRYKTLSLRAEFGADEFSASESVPVSLGWKMVEKGEEKEESKEGLRWGDHEKRRRKA